MAYWGGYPEPLNDPDYDKNSDNVTLKDVLWVYLVAFMLLSSVVLFEYCS